MDLFKSSNPVLTEKSIKDAARLDYTERMTVNGTIGKVGFLLFLLVAAGAFSWSMAARGVAVTAMLYGGAIVGLILAIVMTFKKTLSPILAPVYALAEGLFLGAISMLFESLYNGIVLQAVGITIGVFFCMLFLYRARIIRATERFKSIMFVAISGIAVFYLVAFGLSFFGIYIPFLSEGSPLGIGFSVVVAGIAALSLILDFDRIEEGANYGLPKYYEWYAGFGLLVTIIWLYLEILRLLSKLQSRN